MLSTWVLGALVSDEGGWQLTVNLGWGINIVEDQKFMATYATGSYYNEGTLKVLKSAFRGVLARR